MVEHLPNICKALRLIPITEKIRTKKSKMSFPFIYKMGMAAIHAS
jgi:hypothetical protein